MTISSYPQTTEEIYKKNFIFFSFPNLDQELCKIKNEIKQFNNLFKIKELLSLLIKHCVKD